MNINTLSERETDYKSGDLPIALYKNNMRKEADGKLTYYARTINRGTCHLEDLAGDLIVHKIADDFTKGQLVKVGEWLNNAKEDRLMNGFTVDDGMFRTSAKVYGTFDSEADTFSRERHTIGISCTTTSEMKELLKTIKPVIRQGNTTKPQITSVHDLESKSETTLTKGGFLNIYGTNIGLMGDDETIGLYFVNTADATKTVKLPASKLGTNTSTHLACVVPQSLADGTYQLKLMTQFARGKTPRKEVLSDTFTTEFTVMSFRI